MPKSKNSFLLIIALLGLALFCGCRILPWWGEFGDSGDDPLPGITILSRNLEVSEQVDLEAGEFRFFLPANSVKNSSAITISRLEAAQAGISWPEEFKPISAIYNLRLAPEHITLRKPASITFSLPSSVDPKNCFVMRRANDGSMSLHRPFPEISGNLFSIATLNLSSWTLVQQKSSLVGQLTIPPYLSVSPAEKMIPRSGKFTQDLSIHTMLHSDENLKEELADLKLIITSFEDFKLAVTNTDAISSSRAFDSDSDKQVIIDLFDRSLAARLESGGIATFTCKIKTAGKTISEVPEFLAVQALYSLKSGISYAGYKVVYFSAPPGEDPPAIVSIFPAPNSSQISPQSDIFLKFDSPIEPESFSKALSISPSAAVADKGILWTNDFHQARISFAQPLQASTTYEIRLGIALENAYGFSLKQPIVSRFTTGDGQPPQIVKISPATGTTIAVNSAIKITFDRIVASNTAQISFTPSPANGTSLSWNDKELQIIPLPSWANDSSLTGYLSSGLADPAGNRTATPFEFSYTTGNFKFAEVKQIKPLNQASLVPVNGKIEIQFDQPMKKPETEAAIFITGPLPANRTFTWNGDSTIVELTFTPRLKFSSTYNIEIAQTAESQSGTTLSQSYRSIFSTEPGEEPVVSAVSPVKDSTTVPVGSSVVITFNTPMDTVSVDNALSMADTAANPVNFSTTWTGTQQLTIKPQANLSLLTRYIVEIAASAKNSSGVLLFEDFSTSFTTAANLPGELTFASPANNSTNVKFNQNILLKFSVAIAAETLAFEISPVISGGALANWSSDKKELTLDFPAGFDSNTQYRLKILSTTKDHLGQPIGDIPELAFTAETYSGSRIVAVTPASGSLAIAANSNFTISFDGAMNKGKAESAISFIPPLPVGYLTSWDAPDTKITIVLSGILNYDQEHLLKVSQDAERADGLALVDDYVFKFKTDKQATLASALPSAGATQVSVSTKPELNFSRAPSLSSLQSFLKFSSGGSIISGSLQQAEKKITFSPSGSLPFGATIEAALSAGAVDNDGLPIIPFSFSFVTEEFDNTPPAVINTIPVAGVLDAPLTQNMELLFNKPMNRESVIAALSINPLPAGSRSIDWLDSDKKLQINYSEPLNHSTSYQLKLAKEASDTSGNKLDQDFLLSFSTVSRPKVITADSFPQAGALGIALRPQIVIAFSKPMNKNSAQSAFSLKQSASTITGTYAWDNNKMLFTPANDLLSGNGYSININSSARDTLDNYLETSLSWSFTTTSAEGQSWRKDQLQSTSDSTFSPRFGHSMISFNNRLWITGGFDFEYLNDVWSSDDGISWRKDLATGTPGVFPPRAGHSCAVFAGKIWLTGGYSENDETGVLTYMNDVWSSSNGVTWVKEQDSTDYPQRAWHNLQVFANKLWIIGGETVNASAQKVLLDDCWSSSDGKTWTEGGTITRFFPRKMIMSGVIAGKLWVWGGYGVNQAGFTGPLNDIWATSDGNFWNLVNNNAPFTVRCASGFAFYNNRVWLTGGSVNEDASDTLNDIWASGDGQNWTQILATSSGSITHFSPRAFHQLAPLGDRVFLSGGQSAPSFFNEVWSSK